MQKKIIALAIAGLASTAAFAQSNVTVYGVLDTGYAHLSGTSERNGAYQVGTAAQKSFNGIQGGNSSSNRLGFKGEEALGNGMKAVFNIEVGMNSDGGAAAGGAGSTGWDAATGSRVMTVGVASNNWGTVNLGRQYTPFFSAVAAIDPFGSTGIGSAAIIHPSGVEGVTRSSSSIRWDGAFGPVSVAALYGMGEDNSTAAGGNNRILSFNAIYANGPLVAGIAHIQIEDPVTVNGAFAADDDKAKSTVIGGIYNFGMFKLHAAVNSLKTSGASLPLLALDQVRHTDWHLGVTVPMGAHTFKVTHNRANDKSNRNFDATHWGFGYQYDLSKRTALYANYADVNNKNGAGYSLSRTAVTTQGAINLAPAATLGTYTTGYNVGLKHSF